ncbi:Snf7 family [Neocallimastix sp. 'constans']|jgi:charged multivesicular body protein 1
MLGSRSSAKNMENALFQLKFTAKQLQRNAKKCQKDEISEKNKLKKAIQQGNTEGAKIYALNAIRKKNEGLNFIRLASRIDAVASRVQTAVTMRTVTKSMGNLVKGMDKAMKSMNLEQISAIMDKFESQFEDLDVQTQVMEGTMGQSTTLTTPQEEVDSLMQQVADEHGLELNMELPGAANHALTGDKEQDLLTERLAKLRNS